MFSSKAFPSLWVDVATSEVFFFDIFWSQAIFHFGDPQLICWDLFDFEVSVADEGFVFWEDRCFELYWGHDIDHACEHTVLVNEIYWEGRIVLARYKVAYEFIGPNLEGKAHDFEVDFRLFLVAFGVGGSEQLGLPLEW